MQRTSIKQSGFTLVEIIVITPIIILVLGGVLALLVGLMSDNLASRGELETISDATSAMHIMEDDIKLASAFLTTKANGFTDPYGKGIGNAWSYKGGGAGERVLILQMYATTRSPRDSQKSPVYINQSGCNPDNILTNPALSVNTIYFVENGNLYRRTLTDTSQVTCHPQFQRQSCPPDTASPNPLCKADDALLLANVSAFDIDYYDDPAASAPIDPYPANNPAILDPAVAVKVRITVTRNLSGNTFTFNRELMVSKLN